MQWLTRFVPPATGARQSTPPTGRGTGPTNCDRPTQTGSRIAVHYRKPRLLLGQRSGMLKLPWLGPMISCALLPLKREASIPRRYRIDRIMNFCILNERRENYSGTLSGWKKAKAMNDPRHQLTPEIRQAICAHIRKGSPALVAALAVGVPPAVFERWMRHGQARRPVPKYRDLFEQVRQAEALVLCLAQIRAAHPPFRYDGLPFEEQASSESLAAYLQPGGSVPATNDDGPASNDGATATNDDGPASNHDVSASKRHRMGEETALKEGTAAPVG